jgi:hypothetical protein
VTPPIVRALELALESKGTYKGMSNEQSSLTLSSLSTSIGKHKSDVFRQKRLRDEELNNQPSLKGQNDHPTIEAPGKVVEKTPEYKILTVEKDGTEQGKGRWTPQGKSQSGHGKCSNSFCADPQPPPSIIEIKGVIEEQGKRTPEPIVWPLEVDEECETQDPGTKDCGKRPNEASFSMLSVTESRKSNDSSKTHFDGSGIPGIGPPRKLEIDCADHHKSMNKEPKPTSPSRDCGRSNNQSILKVWPVRLKSLIGRIEVAMQWTPPSPFDSTDNSVRNDAGSGCHFTQFSRVDLLYLLVQILYIFSCGSFISYDPVCLKSLVF